MLEKKFIQEVVTQAVASAKKLVIQLKAWPYDRDKIKACLDEVDDEVQKSLEDLDGAQEDATRTML